MERRSPLLPLYARTLFREIGDLVSRPLTPMSLFLGPQLIKHSPYRWQC